MIHAHISDETMEKGLSLAGEERPTAFLELESTIRACANRIDEQTRFSEKSQELRYQTMILPLLLGLALSGLLCGCASSGQGGQTPGPNSSLRALPPPLTAHAAAHRR